MRPTEGRTELLTLAKTLKAPRTGFTRTGNNTFIYVTCDPQTNATQLINNDTAGGSKLTSLTC